MNFLALSEITLAVVFILTMITQVVIPLWNDRPLFPILNKSRKSIEHNIAELNELEDIEAMNQKLVDILKRRDARITQLEQELKELKDVKQPVSSEQKEETFINPVKE